MVNERKNVALFGLDLGVMTNLIRYNLYDLINLKNHDNSVFTMMTVKMIKDSLYQINGYYEKNKRKFRYDVINKPLLSDHLFSGVIRIDSNCRNTKTIIGKLRDEILDFNKLYSLKHSDSRRVWYSGNKEIERFLESKSFVSITNMSTLLREYLGEYLWNDLVDLHLSEDSYIKPVSIYEKADIIQEMITRYFDKASLSKNIMLVDKDGNKDTEIIDKLIETNYLNKNRSLNKFFSDVAILRANEDSLKIRLELINIYNKDGEGIVIEEDCSKEDLLKAFDDSYLESFKNHFTMIPYKDKATGFFIIKLIKIQESSLSRITKSIITKNLSKVFRHIVTPVSFRDEELIALVPKKNEAGEVYTTLTLFEKPFTLETIKYKLLSIDTIRNGIRTDDKLSMVLIDYIEESLNKIFNEELLSLDMMPERHLLTFVIDSLNHSAIDKFKDTRKVLHNFTNEIFHIISIEEDSVDYLMKLNLVLAKTNLIAYSDNYEMTNEEEPTINEECEECSIDIDTSSDSNEEVLETPTEDTPKEEETVETIPNNEKELIEETETQLNTNEVHEGISKTIGNKFLSMLSKLLKFEK